MDGANYTYLDEKLKEVEGRGFLDYRSEELPTWCPGCGYFGIIQAIYEASNALKIAQEDICVVSGIGCAGRTPIFMKAYGFHTIHGRALPVASGIKMSRKELTVMAIGGDGDMLGIGSGHLPHVARRNVNLTLFLFDNAIYGLTKGQTSPTTPQGQVTNSHPYGNPDQPLNPMALALTYGASFAARGFAGEVAELKRIFQAAIAHDGFSFVHVLTPCVTFDKSNILWKTMGDRLRDLPAHHDTTNHLEAVRLAGDPRPITGIFYQDKERLSWHDYHEQSVANRK